VDILSGLSDVKLWQLFMEVYDMDEDYLIEEVLHLDYTNYPHVNKIVANYMLKGKITKEERESLIGFYILSWHDGEEED
jgi:hypothetical protein